MRIPFICATAIALLTLCSCGGGQDRPWVPTPGAAIRVGADVAPTSPLPADCPAVLAEQPMYRVTAKAAATVTIRDELLVQNYWTVPSHCVAALRQR